MKRQKRGELRKERSVGSIESRNDWDGLTIHKIKFDQKNQFSWQDMRFDLVFAFSWVSLNRHPHRTQPLVAALGSISDRLIKLNRWTESTETGCPNPYPSS